MEYQQSLRNSRNKAMKYNEHSSTQNPGSGRKSPSSKDFESMNDKILKPMLNHSQKSTMFNSRMGMNTKKQLYPPPQLSTIVQTGSS